MGSSTYLISSFFLPLAADAVGFSIGGISISFDCDVLSNSKNPSSSSILVPSFSAFSVFDGPASLPFKKWVVLPLIALVIRLHPFHQQIAQYSYRTKVAYPPYLLMRSSVSLRVIVSNSPDTTKVNPAKQLGAA
jgi:hypothetical protein